MLANAHLVAFVPSSDLVQARQFYELVLGLEVLDVNPYACVFRSGDATLRVAAVRSFTPAPFTVAGWVVADIGEFLNQLSAHGVATIRYPGMEQDLDGVWTTPNGDSVAWFLDPAGNTLSITQLVT